MRFAVSNPIAWRRLDRQLLSVQYMRGIAAVMVLVAHGLPNGPPLLIGLLASAMDLFFVISGFLVVMIADEETRPWTFMKNRAERIVPLYWLITLAAFVIIYSGILEPIFNPVVLARSVAHGDWPFLLQSLVFFPGPSPFEAGLNPLVPQGWTLNYEMYFYLTFAAALYLPRTYMVPALTMVYAALVTGGYLAADSPPLKFWTSPLIFEFILGLWVGVAWRHQWNFRLVFFAGAVAISVLGTVSFRFFSDWPFVPHRTFGLIPIFGVFMAVLAFDRKGGGLGEFRPLKNIGDASYSIYLWHFIPIILLDRIGRTGPVNELVYFLVVILGGTLGGLAVYRWVEQPIVQYVKRRRSAKALQHNAG